MVQATPSQLVLKLSWLCKRPARSDMALAKRKKFKSAEIVLLNVD
jgi:hypothetical protein